MNNLQIILLDAGECLIDNVAWTGNTGDDSTGLREQTAYWIAGELGLPIKVGQNVPNGDLHVSFKLNRDGELLCLFDANGTLVDYVAFGAQTADVSQGRWPDGAPEPFYYMPGPTPRAPNRIPIQSLPRIQIPDLQLQTDGQLKLSWTAQPGRTYRAQYADDLNPPVWHDLPGDVYAPGGVASGSDSVATAPGRRYYRVMLVE